MQLSQDCLHWDALLLLAGWCHLAETAPDRLGDSPRPAGVDAISLTARLDVHKANLEVPGQWRIFMLYWAADPWESACGSDDTLSMVKGSDVRLKLASLMLYTCTMAQENSYTAYA